MNYAELTLREFTNRLGSEDATPGGGGASALAGCLGAALGKMVAHLTIGRKRYAGVQDDMESLIREEEELQREFLNLISRDADRPAFFADGREIYAGPFKSSLLFPGPIPCRKPHRKRGRRGMRSWRRR